MAATKGSASPSSGKPYNTPGAFPSTPSQDESPVVVSSQLSLSQAVHARRAEYTRSRTTRVKIGTWNVAALSGTEKDIGAWFVNGKGVSESLSGLSLGDENIPPKDDPKSPAHMESVESQERRRSKKQSTVPTSDPGFLPGNEEIGIYVLGLQEIVDVSSPTEALRPYTDLHPAKKWKQAVTEVLPKGYQCVAEQQLIGLYLLIHASPAIAPNISSISTTSVGTGLMGYMGNKGAVTARIVVGEATRMVFVNCHLSAGAEKGSLDRRNWDASQIQSRTKFDPVYDGNGVTEEFGESIGDEDFAFWFGDLNYRLEDMPGKDVRRLLLLHTRNEYGKAVASKQKIEHELADPESSTFQDLNQAANQSSMDETASLATTIAESDYHSTASSLTLPKADMPDPSSDPASLQMTIFSLLAHDQLHAQMRERKAFHNGWREGPIDFLPTYKYDVGSVGMFDSSEKRRGPSWCDRILFRTRQDRINYDARIRAEEEAKSKDNEMKLRGVVEEAAGEAVLFDYDPENDGADNESDSNVAALADPDTAVTSTGDEDRLQLTSYTSHQRVLSSDHKPLAAVFTLEYNAVDPELKANIHQEVARELDKAENEGRPVVTIAVENHRDSNASHSHGGAISQTYEGVDFGDIKYDHRKTRNVTIANTGRVPATLSFVERSPDADPDQPGDVAPPWLTIHFDRPGNSQDAGSKASREYTLEPGDAASVTLCILITDLDLVRRLNEQGENLEDVLVLRIQNGRDYFLPVRGRWIQSAFGRSIDKLVRIPEGGVRKLQHQRPDSRNHGDQNTVKRSAPRELFRLTEAIEEITERAVAEWSMRAEDGDLPWVKDRAWPFRGWMSRDEDRANTRELIREGMDSDASFAALFPSEAGSTERLESLSETLIQFLRSLEDGVITNSLWQNLEKGMLEKEKPKQTLSGEDERTRILDTLSSAPTHSVSFTFVTCMLRRVANEIAPLPRSSLRRQGTATSFDEMEAVRKSADDPAKTKRREVDEAYAAIFADVLIRGPAPGIADKVMKASDTRRKHVVRVFLESNIGDDV